MTTRYQLILLGNESEFLSQVTYSFKEALIELGVKEDIVAILHAANFSQYKRNAPTVCLYFGGADTSANLKSLNILIDDGCFVIPVVEDLSRFSSLVPQVLYPLNGFRLNTTDRVPALVSRILESLMLLRKSRRLFISYRRTESRNIALQLYGSLDEAGFNVFLDTHSIGPGAQFQDELWHSLADTDVLVLLNTDNFVGNKWTDVELARASDMSIGITQVVWPGCNKVAHIDHTALATPIYLDHTDFVGQDTSGDTGKLTGSMLKTIEQKVEWLRARALAARQDIIIKEFLAIARLQSVTARLHPEGVIIFSCGNKKIAAIALVGIPDIYTSYQKENLIREIWKNDVDEIWILYDNRLLLKSFHIFMEWLTPLPVKFKTITNIGNLC